MDFFRSRFVKFEAYGHQFEAKRLPAPQMVGWMVRHKALADALQKAAEVRSFIELDASEVEAMAGEIASAVTRFDGEAVEGLSPDLVCERMTVEEIAVCWANYYMACRLGEPEKKA